VGATLDVIGIIAKQYGTQGYADVVVGIQLLNEPYMAGLSGGRGATQGYYEVSVPK